MSIFYPDPPATSQDPKKPQDIPAPAAIALLVVVLGALAYQKLPNTEALYFRLFQPLYMGAYGLLAALALLLIWQITKRTKDLTARGALLAEARPSQRAIRVGRTDDGVVLHLSQSVRTGHVQIIGSTGRGKTESVIVPWLCRDVLDGRSVILIDGKGDPEIVEKVCEMTRRSGSNPKIHVFDLGNPRSSCTTNPLQNGSAQQITDRIFTAFTFEDPYYRSVQYDITAGVVQLIQEQGEPVTFRRLYSLLTDDTALAKLVVNSQSEMLKQKVTRHLGTPKHTRDEKLSGLLSQIAPFAVGEVAPLVNGKTDKKDAWTISDTILAGPNEQSVLVLLIPTLKYQQLGHQLGKLLLQELAWTVGERASREGGNAPFTPVYLDEFSAFVYEGFANILNKARSSRVALHISHQSLADLALVSRGFAEVVITNTNVKCILGVNDPDSADFLARHMGTETEEKLTEQAEDKGFFSPRDKTGRMSIREVESYRIHPNRLKNFMNGRGVLHLPTRLGNISEEIQFERFCGEVVHE